MTQTDEPYLTLAEAGSSEIVVERSRFLGLAVGVESEEGAMQRVDEVRSEHYDARHVCYGLRVGHGARRVDRSNDDGEPARTGGFPLWQLLEGDGLTDALLVVVRYYGGVKLGTGGLARAYRETGRTALEDAGTIVVHPEEILEFDVPYAVVDRLEHMVENAAAMRFVDRDYAADVAVRLAVRKASLDDVRRRLGVLLQRDPGAL